MSSFGNIINGPCCKYHNGSIFDIAMEVVVWSLCSLKIFDWSSENQTRYLIWWVIVVKIGKTDGTVMLEGFNVNQVIQLTDHRNK